MRAGFLFPADYFSEYKLDLNEYLIKHPSATFFVKVEGESMVDAGIHTSDILIVDCSITPVDGKVVIAAVDGEFVVKRLKHIEGKPFLISENPDYKPIEMEEGMELTIWGVVKNVIHEF
ncbi:MAG: translesion error-prone DNA polymerase V autoproteolytic subunit [Caldisericia bacterium]